MKQLRPSRSPLCVAALTWILALSALAGPYTPAPGSPQRVAIANAMRRSAAQLGDDFARSARRGEKFVIAWLKVEGPYAFFEGGGQEINGEMTYGPVDIVGFLRNTPGGWEVLNLQARGDVPSPEEVAAIRASLPRDFPAEICNPFWRKQVFGD